jgi:glycosyltransferase involved in cell wall biosynthesis
MSLGPGSKDPSVLEAAFAVPGDLDTPTGGYAYARKLFQLLPDFGVRPLHLRLPGSFPHPSQADLVETALLLREHARGEVLLVDGLALGAIPAPALTADVTAGRPLVGLVHHPLAFETGLLPERQAELMASEAAALALAYRVIATSPLTARLLAADFNVAPEKITVAEPGTEPAPRARGTGTPVSLLAVGAVSARKGYDILVRALGELREPYWRLTIAGSLNRNPEATGSLKDAIAGTGLADRITLAGAVGESELDRLYDSADLFVSPSRFEGYGMALAEAMARGLPLVASTGGAAVETIPDGAALKVPPGDVAALRDALRDMIADTALRRRCADASWAAGQTLPRWSDTARKVAAVLHEAAR